MKRRAVFFIAIDENGVDPRPDPHDTARMGRAWHGSEGAAPAVATSKRSRRRLVLGGECTRDACAVRPKGSARGRQGNRAVPPLWISSPPPPDSSPVAAAGYLPTAPPKKASNTSPLATAVTCSTAQMIEYARF